MRHEVEVVEVIGGFTGRIALGESSSRQRPRLELISLLATISILLLVAPAALAQTPGAHPLDGLAPPAAIALAALSAEIPAEIPEEVAASSSATAPAAAPTIVESAESAPPPIPEALLTLRSRTTRRAPAKTTDELIAAAVALGTNPDLEPKNPFRKRSHDLFRTERPVTIGNQDLIVRLRLRAKARRAVNLEFRY